MSSRTPFRSHLLQQWTQHGRRPPMAAVPWLRPAPTSRSEEGPPRRTHGPDDEQPCRSDSTSTSSIVGSAGGQTLSSIDSSSFSSWSTKNIVYDGNSFHRGFASGGRGGSSGEGGKGVAAASAAFSTTSSIPSAPTDDGENARAPTDDEIRNDDDHLSRQLHSLLLSRRTAARPLVFSTSNDASEPRRAELEHLRDASDRAVQAAQTAPNHKRTEPFTFTRFWCASRSANTLADICYQVTLRHTKSEPVARKKREKWSQIPAFLVATVHDNQQAAEATEENGGSFDLYEQLEYSPPLTLRQLEDVRVMILLLLL